MVSFALSEKTFLVVSRCGGRHGGAGGRGLGGALPNDLTFTSFGSLFSSPKRKRGTRKLCLL